VDKRFKGSDPERDLQARERFYAAALAGQMSVGEAVAAMRRLSKLTQPEFAAHRGVSVESLRQIESDTGNPTISTLNKIAKIFGLRVGFVKDASPKAHPKTENPAAERKYHED
jgi:transcriptional regulator with XRE-family HTH domain